MARTDDKVGYPLESEGEGSASSKRCTPEEAEDALRILEGKWKLYIIFRLFEEPVVRFAELRRKIPGITEKMLIQQLKDLESVGLIWRNVYPEVPPKVEYSLTTSGRNLYPVLDELLNWWKSNGRPLRRT